MASVAALNSDIVRVATMAAIWARVRSSDMISVSVRQSQLEPMERRSNDTVGDSMSRRTYAEAKRVGKLMHDRQDTDAPRGAVAADCATREDELTVVWECKSSGSGMLKGLLSCFRRSWLLWLT
jgi:hypothetical protein